VAVNLTRDWLLANGISEDVIAAALARSNSLEAAAQSRRNFRSLGLPGEPSLVSATGGPGWWEGEITGWRPASDNLRARGMWVWAKAKARDREVIRELLCNEAKIPPATGRRFASLVVTKKSGRGIRDGANLLKSFHDALKTTGLLIDDDEVWLDYVRPVIKVDRELACKVKTIIRLEDI
jgi:hypothetical protein